MPTWNRTNGVPKLHAANRKKGARTPPKNFITLQHPPTECFFPNDIKTRSRTSRGRHAPEFGLSSSRDLARSLSFSFPFSPGQRNSRKFNDSRSNTRSSRSKINTRRINAKGCIDSTYFETERNKRAKRARFYSEWRV